MADATYVDEPVLDQDIEKRRAEVKERLREALDRAHAEGCYDFAYTEWPWPGAGYVRPSETARAQARTARQAEENFENVCADYIATGRGLEAMQRSWKAFLEACRVHD